MGRRLSAEWLRMRKYWLTWALFALWIIILVLQVNAKLNRLEELEAELTEISIPEASVPSPDGEGEDQLDYMLAQLQMSQVEFDILQENLRYPAFVGYVARLATGSGWFLVILYAAVMGSEDFSRRTLGPILSRGVKRTSYLLTRGLALWLVSGAGLVVIAGLSMVGGLYTHAQVSDNPVAFAGLGEGWLFFLRAWLTCLPFIVTTLFWAVLARNAGPAVGVSMGLHALEAFAGFMLPVMALLIIEGADVPGVFHGALKVMSISLGYNTDVFLHWGSPFGIDLGNETILPTMPWRSAAFLAGYTLIYLLWSLWIVHRRDITKGA